MPSIVAIKVRQPEFQKNMWDIASRDEGLQALLRKRHEAQQKNKGRKAMRPASTSESTPDSE